MVQPAQQFRCVAYHMPCVLYWAEQVGVGFFPTQYLNQIRLQPLAEYAMLHLYLLADSDRLINFVQWSTAFGSVIGVSAVAAAWAQMPGDKRSRPYLPPPCLREFWLRRELRTIGR